MHTLIEVDQLAKLLVGNNAAAFNHYRSMLIREHGYDVYRILFKEAIKHALYT